MDQAVAFALKCPSCGAPLQVKATVETFACAYCASTVQVERSGGAISLHLLKDALRGVQRGTDRTASELAIRRLNEELAQLNQEVAGCEAKHANISNAWRNRMQPVEQRSHILAVGLTAFFVWLFSRLILGLALEPLVKPDNKISTFFATFSLLASLAIAGFVAFKLLQILRRGKARAIASLSASRDKELADAAKEIAGAKSQVDAAKKSIAVHRQMVA